MTKYEPFWSHRVFVIFVALLLAMSASVSHAQIEGKTRAYYNKSLDVPINLYFPYFVESLTDISDEHDREHRLEEFKDRLKLKSQAQAADIWSALIAIRYQNRESKQHHMRTAVCPLNYPRPTGQRVFEVLDEFDDHNEYLGQSNLSALGSTLDPNSYQLLRDWASERSAKAKIFVFDHAKLYQGRNPDVVRQEICGRFDTIVAEMQSTEGQQ